LLLSSGHKLSQGRNKQKVAHLASSARSLLVLGLIFDPDDGSDMLLENIGFSLKYTQLKHRKPYWSNS
jgi:hypothetical protein